ncbi:hypothetical protein GALMADRAFT_19059, partial [Galerina marginata CBS 339.88]
LSPQKGSKILSCDHVFCRRCLRKYTVVKVGDRRCPIPCPGCLADPASGSSMLEEDVIKKLKIPSKVSKKLVQLQIDVHAVSLTCPSCETSMYIDRQDYLDNKTLACPRPGCTHKWCRDCNEQVAGTKAEHRCTDAVTQLDRVMQQKGWRYCPGAF